MEQLKNEELITINGGAVKVGVIIAIISTLISIVGIIDGFFRPLKCNVK